MSKKKRASAATPQRGIVARPTSLGGLAVVVLIVLITWLNGARLSTPPVGETQSASTQSAVAAAATDTPPATATATATEAVTAAVVETEAITVETSVPITATLTAPPTETPTGRATSPPSPTATTKPTTAPTKTATPLPTRKPTATPLRQGMSGLPTVDYDKLPREAKRTIALIDDGGPFPFRQDDSVFQNREGILPRQPRGYYREYTVITPGEDDRGARRIVAGEEGELFYTDDHYASFREVLR